MNTKIIHEKIFNLKDKLIIKTIMSKEFHISNIRSHVYIGNLWLLLEYLFFSLRTPNMGQRISLIPRMRKLYQANDCIPYA